jgi:arsenate reductase
MTKEEKIELLSNNAMLIKRPILVCDNNILVGFKEKEWKNINDK